MRRDLLPWKSHRDSVGHMRLDFLWNVFLDEEFDGSSIIVDEYRLRRRSDGRMGVRKETYANHDFCLTDVVERVRVTSLVAEADRQSARQLRVRTRKCICNAFKSQIGLPVFLTYSRSTLPLSSQLIEFFLHELFGKKSRSSLGGFCGDASPIV